MLMHTAADNLQSETSRVVYRAGRACEKKQKKEEDHFAGLLPVSCFAPLGKSEDCVRRVE